MNSDHCSRQPGLPEESPALSSQIAPKAKLICRDRCSTKAGKPDEEANVSVVNVPLKTMAAEAPITAKKGEYSGLSSEDILALLTGRYSYKVNYANF